MYLTKALSVPGTILDDWGTSVKAKTKTKTKTAVPRELTC